jgi:hypothetical protein
MKKILFAALLTTMMPFGFSYAQTDYKMQGPYEVVARDGAL